MVALQVFTVPLPCALLPIVPMVMYYKQRACRPHEHQAQTRAALSCLISETVSELVGFNNARDRRDSIHSQTRFYNARAWSCSIKARVNTSRQNAAAPRGARHTRRRRILVWKHDSGAGGRGWGGGGERAVNYAFDCWRGRGRADTHFRALVSTHHRNLLQNGPAAASAAASAPAAAASAEADQPA
jgi:hypothetical protein